MPRVTDVIGYIQEPELVDWMLRTPKAKREAIREEAFRIGTAVDLLVQQDIKDGGYLIPEGDEAIANCMRGWEDFKKAMPEFVRSVSSMQDELIDRENEVTGHPDFLIRRKESWGIVDLKTSSGIRPTYWTQTAQYSEMVRKHDEPFILKNWEVDAPRFIGVLRLDKKNGAWEYKEIADETVIRYEVEVFRAMLLLYRHGESVRETLRQQLEKEILEIT